jgi:hypothetical protein
MTEETHTPSRRAVLRNGALAGAGLTLGLGATGSAKAATVVTDDPQSAIDDAEPGDTIVVEDGTYAGTLTVDVPDLTVRAENYRGAVISGGDSTTGAAVSIEADGVTFERFEVTFPGGLLGIKVTRAGPSTPRRDVTVRQNYVTDVGPTGTLGVTGIIADEPQVGLRILQNVVDGVEQEEFYNQAQGIFVDDVGGGGIESSEIIGNAVRNVTSEAASIGIITNADATDLTVQGNTVERVSSTLVGDFDFAQGLNVSGGTADVRLARNVVEDVTATFFVGTGLKIDGEADGLTAEFNDLLPTVGIENADDDPVTATCNYWGHPKGPREVGSNREADDGPNRQGRSAVVGPAEFEPWLVRSITNGENLENSCVGGRGGGGGGGGNGNGRGR